MPSPFSSPLSRLPLLAIGMASLLSGVLGGLLRFGWDTPSPSAAPAWHGALMISAFFGTVISLERAVALGRPWAYLGPVLAGSGGLALLAGLPPTTGAALLTAASVVLGIGGLSVIQRQLAAFTVVLALGAGCWLLGNVWWLLAGDASAAIPSWLAFLILTIAGERLELTRLLPTPPVAKRLFLVVVGVILAGVALGLGGQPAGMEIFSVGLIGLAAWLARWDIARRNIRQAGLTRFIAACLLAGYAWLAIGGILGLAGALAAGHPWRDPALHALTLGFVFSMVFGHAPIVLPAVARITLPYRPAMYLPLLVLHATLALRVAGSLAESAAAQRLGALGNALALLLFIATLVASVWAAKRQTARKRSE